MYEVVIVGGGTAGLSAALVLGRARRRVLVLDGGPPRNAPAQASHGFFTRDGTPPLELLELGRAQLVPYGTVELRQAEAVGARRLPDGFGGFEIALDGGGQVRGRALLLASGVVDELPAIPGFRELWGRGVYHCPYCHGWEVRDEPLGVYARGEIAMHLAPLIRQWSHEVSLLSDGPDLLDDEQHATLARRGIGLRDDRITRLVAGETGQVEVVLAGGERLRLGGLFARVEQRPRNVLARELGCQLVEDGLVPGLIRVDEGGQTTVPGVYAAGDVVTALQQVVVAAAGGAVAAAMLNLALVRQDAQVAQR